MTLLEELRHLKRQYNDPFLKAVVDIEGVLKKYAASFGLDTVVYYGKKELLQNIKGYFETKGLKCKLSKSGVYDRLEITWE